MEKEEDKQLKEAFQDLQDLRVDVAYPFLLELYHDYKTSMLCHADFLEAVRLIESYVFRRAICSYATNSLNKTFANFSKTLDKEAYLDSIKANFMSMKTYRIFPDDNQFKSELQKRAIYNIPARCRYFLYKIENYQRKERIVPSEYSIEHIMPQNQNLSQEWIDELGDDWEKVHNTYLHTVGNLTLTGYNSEYKDLPFSTKRDMEMGFSSSPLKLNEGLGQEECWNEQAISRRAQRLSELAVLLWKGLDYTSEQLACFQARADKSDPITLSDHPFLLQNKPKELYQALRQKILAIDPDIREEILKSYIAYKASTNILDIDPRSSCLLIYVNLPYETVKEPCEICRDVSNIGHSGNGDIEIRFSDLDELPYIISLAKQAFQYQIGIGDDE